MKPVVLYVDDEPHNLNQFMANFRHIYEVVLADSAEMAQLLLERHSPAILLADQRLPRMSGVQLLEYCQKRFPDTVRILVTGYNDNEPLIEAINRGSIYYYIQKPWNLDQLTAILMRAGQYHFQQKLIKSQNEDLIKMVDELERFVYSISHDIRAPLMSVLGLIQLLRLEPENTPKYLEFMEQSVHKLDTFIKNIISHYKNIRTENTVKEIDVKSFLNFLAETQLPTPALENIHVQIIVDQTTPLLTDEFRLNLVLANLINNAGKYFRPNQEDKFIAIEANISELEAVFTIEDNGRGIDSKHLTSIFNIFYRISADKAGSGLGLYLVKETVSKMNGSVYVESDPGNSTKFTVRIPNHYGELTRS